MKPRFLLFSITVLAFGAQATAADLCTEPIKAICEAPITVPQVTEEQIRAEVAKKSSSKELTSLSGDAAADASAIPEYKKYISEVSKRIAAKFAAMGIKESDIKARIAKIVESVAKNIEDGRIGPPLASSGPLSDADLAAKVRSVTLEEQPTSDAEAESFYYSCGVDGMVSQAFYSPDSNTFVLCPGFLLETLNSGSIYSLDEVVAHELSHSVDGEATSVRHDKYVPYLSCVQDNYAGEFNTADEVLKQLGQPAQDRLKMHLDELKKDPGAHAAEILDTQDQMRIAKQQVKRLTEERARIQAHLGHVPTIADTHAGELTADLGGSEALVRMLKDVPKEKRGRAVIGALKSDCDNSLSAAKTVKYGPLKDDALHPPESFRVGILFNNPELRLLLGCKDLTGKGPSCPAGKRSPLATRCTLAMGVTSATQCEKLILVDLQSAGCHFTDLGCGPFDGKVCDCSMDSSNCRQPFKGPSPANLACAGQGSKQDLKLIDSLIPGVCVVRPQVGVALPTWGTGSSASEAK